MPALAALASTPPIERPVCTAMPWELSHINGIINPSSPFLSHRSLDTKLTQSRKLQAPGLWQGSICREENLIQHNTRLKAGGLNTIKQIV